MVTANQRKSDKNLYNENAQDYIPVACHYDNDTLLTKNGELIQVLQVAGMAAGNITVNLDELTRAMRESLSKHIHSTDFACWVHTIRRKENLDDILPYSNKFSADMHEMWATKNYLRERFVNCLYVSIVFKDKGFYVDNGNLYNLASWTSTNTVTAEHEKYLGAAVKQLYTATDNIMQDLAVYGPSRLCIKTSAEKSISETLYLFGHILNFGKNEVELPLRDFSKALAVERYAVGARQIEVIDKNQTHFVSILSLREYHRSKVEDLFAKVLQLPVEIVATEIFFPVNSKYAQSSYEHQNYILEVSRDEDLKIAKGIDLIMDAERRDGFCEHQLSIMIIANDIQKLEIDTTKVSKNLSMIGVVHIREDINLENVFWSQLPSNFQFMRRHIPGVFDDIAAFVSLQNTPHGRKHSKWGSGRAVTILPSIYGTPYFTNFHSEKNTGHTCFFGGLNSGKTVLMNFLVSEAMKFNPTIIYLALDTSSKLFINALGGHWMDVPKLPVLSKDNNIGVEILVEILSGQYTRKFSIAESNALEQLISNIRSAASYQEAVQAVESFAFGESEKTLKDSILKAVPYLKESNLTISNQGIVGINLGCFKDAKDHDLRAAFVIASLRSLGGDKTTPKMLVIDEMTDVFDHPYFVYNMDLFLQLAESYNVSVIGTIDTDKYINVSQKELWKALDNNTDLKVVMSHKNISYNLVDLFGLTEHENEELLNIEYDSVFILKPYGRRSIITQLSGAGLGIFLRILSSGAEELKILEEVKAAKGDNAEDWLPELYIRLESGI